jgi:carbon-monoxide dehydrogenase small subunit
MRQYPSHTKDVSHKASCTPCAKSRLHAAFVLTRYGVCCISGLHAQALGTQDFHAGQVESFRLRGYFHAMKKRVTLRVNGEEHSIEVEANRLLLHALREEIGLTGTKEGCSIGVCGACSVILDGRLVSSCLTLAAACNGREVQTIEGLAEDGKLHPLQQAFIEYGGFQCGICTPGQIMAAKALLDENPSPDEEEVKEWMSGNLCRCTGYYKILESVMAVVNGKTDPNYAFRKRETTAKIQSLDVYKPVAKT